MGTEKLFRWSGLSLILGGLLSPLSILIHPSQETVDIILGQTWRLVTGHILGTISIIFILLGLVGMYVYEADSVGRLGFIGFILAFIGNVLLATSGNYGYIAPVLAANAPDLLSAINAYPPELSLDVIMVLSFLFGFILLGLATFRAHRLPRWSGALIAIGPFLFFIFSGIALSGSLAWVYWLGFLGQVLFGTGLILAGRALRANKKITAEALLRYPLESAK